MIEEAEWTGRSLARMSVRALADAIRYLEESGQGDEPLLTALHEELACRIAASLPGESFQSLPSEHEPPADISDGPTLEGKVLSELVEDACGRG